MEGKDYFGWVTTAVASVCTSVQTDDILRWISFGIAILSGAVTLAYNIWIWWKKAKEDGVVTPDEVKDLTETIADGVNDIKDAADEALSDKEDGE